MKIIFDVETTTTNKGNPFDPRNRLMAVGVRGVDNPLEKEYNIEHPEDAYTTYKDKLVEIQAILNQTTELIGFNLKFDIHWLRRYGVTLPANIKIWDCSLAHYLKTSQLKLYPSLDDVAVHYGLPLKIDTVKTEYWDKGIDTNKIPWNILSEYLHQDLFVTENVFKAQQKDTTFSNKKTQGLVYLLGQDLICLEEMEWNGLLYDREKSIQLASECTDKISNIDSELDALIGSTFPLNYASNDHKSILLYGGSIDDIISLPYIKKDGTVSLNRTRKATKTYIYPQLVKPIRGSELKKSGYYSTDEGTLRKLRSTGKAKKIVSLLLERTKLMRLKSTYYEGLVNILDEYNWGNTIHGSLNQCSTITGRLSSEKPNLQNNPTEIDQLFRSRYD